MEPLVLRCRILAPYVPLRATSSKSVPSVDIVYIAQRSVTNREFRNYLIEAEKERIVFGVKYGNDSFLGKKWIIVWNTCFRYSDAESE